MRSCHLGRVAADALHLPGDERCHVDQPLGRKSERPRISRSKHRRISQVREPTCKIVIELLFAFILFLKNAFQIKPTNTLVSVRLRRSLATTNGRALAAPIFCASATPAASSGLCARNIAGSAIGASRSSTTTVHTSTTASD